MLAASEAVYMNYEGSSGAIIDKLAPYSNSSKRGLTLLKWKA